MVTLFSGGILDWDVWNNQTRTSLQLFFLHLVSFRNTSLFHFKKVFCSPLQLISLPYFINVCLHWEREVAFFLHWEPEDCLPLNTCIKRDLSHPRSLPFFLMHWHLKATSYNKAEKLWQSSYMQFWWSKHLIIQQWVISAVTSFCHDCITSANSPKQKS